MTLRELGNSIVQFVVDVYFHFYDTLVKVKKVHSLDLEIKDIFTVILLWFLLYCSICYVIENVFSSLINDDYYENRYVTSISLISSISILIYLINFLIPSYQ